MYIIYSVQYIFIFNIFYYYENIENKYILKLNNIR